MRLWCPVGCIVFAFSSLTECRIMQRDVTLVRLLPHTLLCFTKSLANDFSVSQEKMRLLKLIFTFICNNLKSHCMQGCLQFHLSLTVSTGMKACRGRIMGHVCCCICNVVTPHYCLVGLHPDVHRAWGLSSPLETRTEGTKGAHHCICSSSCKVYGLHMYCT